MALVKVAEEVRDLGTRGKGKGGLERAVCPASLTEQPSSSDGIKPHRAPGWFKLFSKAELGWENGHKDHKADSFKSSSEERNVQ